MKTGKRKAVIFANIVLSSMSVTCILMIFYSLYKSYSYQIPVNITLLTVPAAGLLFSIGGRFFPENLKINIAVLIISVVVAAFSVECILFIKANLKYLRMNIDKRSKLEVIMDMRAQNIDTWPFFTYRPSSDKSYEHDLFPFGGISKKMSIVCNESGQYTIFKSDEHGFNNPSGLYEKTSIESVLVGDSFTLGACVMSGEDIASQLRKNGISSLNLGNYGIGPLTELAILKEYAEPLNVKIVLWMYYEGNDLSDLMREQKSSLLMRYLGDGYRQNLFDRQDEIDALLTEYLNSKIEMQMQHESNNQVLRSKTREVIKNSLLMIKLWHVRNGLGLINVKHEPQSPGPDSTMNNDMQLSLFSEIIAIAQRRSSGWGGKFYFVYLPMKPYDGYFSNGGSENRDNVLAIVHKLGIPLIDYYEVLKKHPNPLSLFPFFGRHYNAAGYELVSEIIVSRLQKDGLITEINR